ncbi:MAG: PadR family transcriptional regulator [Ardenticatenaceae bacterium]|nr:PadR family transcriptional regulator [Ardenticatenaceae bacterium]
MVRLPLTTEHALLGFLRRRPMYGYEIYQQLSDPAGLGLVWRLKQSQLYALLARLEHEGYITATLEPQDARPPRKVFRLTEAGREAFLAWVQSPVPRGRALRLEFLAKLYFARHEGLGVVERLVAAQRAACQSWRAEQQAQAAARRDAHPYDWLVCQFRIGQIEAMLAWLDTCQQMIAENGHAGSPTRR